MLSKEILNMKLKDFDLEERIEILTAICFSLGNPFVLANKVASISSKRQRKIREKEFRKRLNSKNTRGGRYE